MRRPIHNKNMDRIPLVWNGISLGTIFHTPMCEKRHLQRGLTKSTSAGYEVESTTWDSAEIEEGIFLYGGNPNGWGPWRDSLHFLYMERRRAIVIHAYVYDFMSIQTLSILCCLARITRKILFSISSPSWEASWRLVLHYPHLLAEGQSILL